MQIHSTILVHELLSTSIHSREASSVLMKVIEEDMCDHIELDFSAVEYISRSFADQLHFDKLNYAMQKNKTIIVSNASDIVLNMLQAVAKTQNSSVHSQENLPVFKYSNQNQLENFLLGV